MSKKAKLDWTHEAAVCWYLALQKTNKPLFYEIGQRMDILCISGDDTVLFLRELHFKGMVQVRT